MPAYERAFAEHEAEIAAIAGQAAAADLRQHHRGAGERRPRCWQRVDDVFGQLVGTDSNDALLAIERDISPRTAAHWNKVRMNEALFAPHRRAASASATASASPPSRRACWSAITPGTAARAPALDAGKKKRLAEIVERLAALGTAFSQNVLADEQSYTMELDGEADLAGLPDFVRAAARGRRRRARHDGQARHHAVALQRRAVPAILVAARSAREGVPRLDRARRQRRQDRQQGDHRRDHGAARRARQAARLSDLRALPARRRHGEDAGGGARPARKGLDAGARGARSPTATPCRS